MKADSYADEVFLFVWFYLFPIDCTTNPIFTLVILRITCKNVLQPRRIQFQHKKSWDSTHWLPRTCRNVTHDFQLGRSSGASLPISGSLSIYCSDELTPLFGWEITKDARRQRDYGEMSQVIKVKAAHTQRQYTLRWWEKTKEIMESIEGWSFGDECYPIKVFLRFLFTNRLYLVFG